MCNFVENVFLSVFVEKCRLQTNFPVNSKSFYQFPCGNRRKATRNNLLWFIMCHETTLILIDQLTKNYNFLKYFNNNEVCAAKFDQFYLIGTKSNTFHILKNEYILEKCIIIIKMKTRKYSSLLLLIIRIINYSVIFQRHRHQDKGPVPAQYRY